MKHIIQTIGLIILFVVLAVNGSAAELKFNIDPNDPLKRPVLEDHRLVLSLARIISLSYEAKDWRGADTALSSVIGEVEINGKKQMAVRFANKEIHDAVIELYFKVRELANSTEGKKWISLGEGGEWATFDLCTYAESTFSPRIYEEEVFRDSGSSELDFGPGLLRVEYLARVNQEETLNILMNSNVKSDGIDTHVLTYGPKKRRLCEMPEAYEILSRMRETSPDLLKKNKDQLRRWIIKNVNYCAFAYEMRIWDYKIRNSALELLNFYAEPADQELMKQISENALVLKRGKTDEDRRLADTLRKKMEELLIRNNKPTRWLTPTPKA